MKDEQQNTWQQMGPDLRDIVLKELDRESAESEDVTNAYQIARSLLWELWDDGRPMCQCEGCEKRAQENGFYCSSGCHMKVYNGEAMRVSGAQQERLGENHG